MKIKTTNNIVIDNFLRVRLSSLFIPFILLITVVLFLFYKDVFSAADYVEIQKSAFYFINAQLSQFPKALSNLTELGNAVVALSLLSIFIVYAPKVWEALIPASIVSTLFSNILKSIFSVPRPAANFDNNSFTIVGETLTGHNSLPSGHSITIFTSLTILLFAFMPQQIKNKILWTLLLVTLGATLALTRVGVGAHFPLDVLFGCMTGYLSAVLGIFFCNKFTAFAWVNNKNYLLVFLLLIFLVLLIKEIMHNNLPMYYVAFIASAISIFKIAYVYFKK
jgi:membrane-associated phospholipid phosphatase